MSLLRQGDDCRLSGHEYVDWSNIDVKNLFVCIHCGKIRDCDTRIGRDVSEFREFMKNNKRNLIVRDK